MISEESKDPLVEAGLRYQDVGALSTETDEAEIVPRYSVAAEDLHAAVEAVLFASGEPIGIERIADATGTDKERILKVLHEMEERTASDRRRGTMVREVEGLWFLSTKPSAAEPLRRLLQPRNRPPLSQAAYETLAIIAYNQPATRSQIESIRGVGSDSIVARLIERGLIREAGTLDAPGRPTLFETTEEFLQEFGLRSVHELPSMEMMMYGTLREIEVQLEEAAGTRKDNQITIEQIAPEVSLPSIDLRVGILPEEAEDLLELSEAFFGSTKEPEEISGMTGTGDAE